MGSYAARDEIDFYFDLVSPFAYLAFQQIGELAARHGRSVRYRAIDLAAVKHAAGNSGPSNRDIPPKFAYLKEDLHRWAAILGVPFSFPPPGPVPAGARDSSLAQRGVYFAAMHGKTCDYMGAVWRQTWGRGGLIGAPDVLDRALDETGLPRQSFWEYVASDAAAVAYAAETERASAAGVFGVPTMVVHGAMFWGNDRLAMLERFLTETPPGA